jgi:hypothetical protein
MKSARILVVSALMVLLHACAIPVSAIKPDGTVTIDYVGPATYRIAGHLYFASALQDALARARLNDRIKRYELRIPAELLKKDSYDKCGGAAQVMVEVAHPWTAYSWISGNARSMREIECDVIVVA